MEAAVTYNVYENTFLQAFDSEWAFFNNIQTDEGFNEEKASKLIYFESAYSKYCDAFYIPCKPLVSVIYFNGMFYCHTDEIINNNKTDISIFLLFSFDNPLFVYSKPNGQYYISAEGLLTIIRVKARTPTNLIPTTPPVNKRALCGKQFKTYLMIDSRNGLYKIGKAYSPSIREKHLQSEVPKIKLVFVINENVEADLHKKYKEQRVRGEYFKLEEKDVAEIMNNYKIS